MIDRTWVRGFCVLAAVLMAAAIFVGAETASEVPLFPPPFDKVAHFVYYAAMALLLVHGVGLRLVLLPLLLVPLVGALDEWHQLSVPGRDGSVWDWVADSLGAVVAVVGYRALRARERKDKGTLTCTRRGVKRSRKEKRQGTLTCTRRGVKRSGKEER